VKNLWSKTRKPENAYLVVTSGTWTWYVLKAYQTRKAEKTNDYARWLCKVVSPMTGPSGDWGDTYINDIPLLSEHRAVLAKREAEEALA
jgi:hypothetical protein